MSYQNKSSKILHPALHKNGKMYAFIIFVWLMLIIYYDRRLFSFLEFRQDMLEVFLVACLIIFLNIFWFHGIYHLGIWLFSKTARKRKEYSIPIMDKVPNAAVLYLTKDDFNGEALQTCLKQDYQNFHIFILDDSIGAESKLEIDNFIKKYPDKLSLVRRPSPEGYKAGNLNHALSLIHKDYPYFAVCDADTCLPKDFLKTLISYFQIDKSIGFVQANHRCYSDKNSGFAYDFSFTEDVYWKYYVRARERYGFTMFHGRGAIIKTGCWKEIGGFPYSLTEDLVFSCRLREKGYRGIFVPDIVCSERYPKDYIRHRRRYNRWIQGTTSYFIKRFCKILWQKDIPWFEKMDIIASGIVLNLSVFFIGYIILVGLAFPVFYYKYVGLWSRYYHYVWTWDFFLVMVTASLLQLIPIFGILKERPFAIFRRLSLFISISVGSVINNTVQSIIGLLGIKSPFLVTGASDIKVSGVERALFLAELICGMGLSIFAVFTVNIWILGVGIAIIFSPFLAWFGWNNGFIRALCYMPLALSIIAMVLLGLFIKMF